MNFKINIESYLHRIDSAFKQKSKKDIKLTYLMIIGSIFAFAYLFWDSSADKFLTSNSKITTLQTKINVDKTFIQANTEAVIINLDHEIKKVQVDLAKIKDQNAYIKSKIETISSLIYDEQKWGKYINSIASHAKKYNIKILKFSNKYTTSSESFGHMLDLEINLTGNYKNTLKFINSLEQSDLVIDIHNLDIKAQNRLNTNLQISVWGITY